MSYPDDPAPLRRRLLAFFDRSARDLPWRRTSDPYAIWVSEVMLQQTRVDVVKDYYQRWMTRFPDIPTLADADLDDVLTCWAGLGYYARARNLHSAAGLVRDAHGGSVPAEPEALRALPGIGEYTAGALGSIAFGRAEPAVDGNVRRVLSRLLDLEAPTPASLRAHATRLVDRERPGAFNQALMELGATVCTPRAPDCEACPVRIHCRAHARGTVELRPPPVRRSRVRTVHFVSFVARLPEGRTLLRKRPLDGLLGGLWEFPAVSVEGPPAGLPGSVGLAPVPHTFSHLQATYYPVRVPATQEVTQLTAGPVSVDLTDAVTRVATWEDLDDLALPVAQRKIAAQAR